MYLFDTEHLIILHFDLILQTDGLITIVFQAYIFSVFFYLLSFGEGITPARGNSSSTLTTERKEITTRYIDDKYQARISSHIIVRTQS